MLMVREVDKVFFGYIEGLRIEVMLRWGFGGSWLKRGWGKVVNGLLFINFVVEGSRGLGFEFSFFIYFFFMNK